MTKILLVTETSAKANRPHSFEYLISPEGSVDSNIARAMNFDDEAHVKELLLRHTFIMFEYDGKNLKRLGYVM